MIVLSAGWTILNILKMIAYIDQLKSESPTCTMSNPNRLAILIPTIITLLIVKKPLEQTANDIFMRIIPVNSFPIGSKQREAKAAMLGERIFRLVISVTSLSLLYKILLQEDCDFLHVALGGN